MMKSAGSAIQHAQTTGAKLTKLISYSLWIGMLGSNCRPCIERRRILSEVFKRVKQEKFYGVLLS